MTLCTELSHYFRGGDLIYTREMLDHLQTQLEETGKIVLRRFRHPVNLSPYELFNAQKIFSALSKNNNFRIRVEQCDLSIFSIERGWLYNLAKTVNANEWWEPTGILEPNTLIMGSAMASWEYKITLGPNVPTSFCKWVIQNKEKIKIGNTFMKSVINESKYLNGYYFYVKNEKMLNLVTLVLGPSIQRVDKIVIED